MTDHTPNEPCERCPYCDAEPGYCDCPSKREALDELNRLVGMAYPDPFDERDKRTVQGLSRAIHHTAALLRPYIQRSEEPAGWKDCGGSGHE